jgi:aryl-alcohol dehydrogenase-like predicted oxidoreductase
VGGCVLQKRYLGNTGIQVSSLGLGTVKFGRVEGVKYPVAFTLPSDKEINALLAEAHDLGINLLDTAPAYGTSEERLGKALRGQRDRWIISTKAGEEFVNGQSTFDFSAAGMRSSVERSLLRLQTDYVDIVLVHSNGDDQRIIEEEAVFATLEQLKQEGKLRAYGMSTKTLVGGMQAIDGSDVAMVTFNPTYKDEREVIAYALKNNKGIFIKKALNSGHLPAEESLRFALAEPGVTSVIIGTINPAHLRANALYDK